MTSIDLVADFHSTPAEHSLATGSYPADSQKPVLRSTATFMTFRLIFVRRVNHFDKITDLLAFGPPFTEESAGAIRNLGVSRVHRQRSLMNAIDATGTSPIGVCVLPSVHRPEF